MRVVVYSPKAIHAPTHLQSLPLGVILIDSSEGTSSEYGIPPLPHFISENLILPDSSDVESSH